MQADHHHHPPLLESAEIVVSLALMLACWFGWYVAHERYYLTSRQLAEAATYLIVAVFAFAATPILWFTRRSRCESEWPHPPVVVSRKRDERVVKQGWDQNSVVLGNPPRLMERRKVRGSLWRVSGLGPGSFG